MNRPAGGNPLLILGRDAWDAALLLGPNNIECRICQDFDALCLAINEDVAGVIATEEAFAGVDLGALQDRLALQPPWSDLPFIVLTRSGVRYRAGLDALHLPEVLGNVVFLERPLTVLGLVSAARSSLRARMRQRQTAIHLAERVAVVVRRRNKAYELELEQQKQELQRSNAALEQFAYAASHDLQAPLRAIAHLAQWIDEDVRATASSETLDNLQLLKARVARLQMLIGGLLTYARIGRVGLEAEEVDVAEIVREITALLDPRPDFVVACIGEMLTIRTYRTPIELVLKNLINNALQHHDRSHGEVTVAMRLLDPDTAEIRVSDDGPGIEARYHDDIFVIFRTLKSRDDAERSGIGLAMVKKQVTENGGTIWIESAPPVRGTTFVFTWKLLHDEHAEDSTNGAAHQVEAQ